MSFWRRGNEKSCYIGSRGPMANALLLQRDINKHNIDTCQALFVH